MEPEKRKEYEDKARARLKELDAKVAQLRSQMQETKSEVKTRVSGEIDKLREKHRAIEVKLNEMKGAGERQWDKLKEHIEGAWIELQTSFEHVTKKRSED